ncbi:MAG: hypothetical protein GW795_11115 [Cyanobacteria bacterium]|nr:hypothetical protein [Cyanobacteria bacterium CG_2015-16_32_12]NCO77458.1 hypothetical protein [Cyanobacteria bacterium CG_2015-22_32_23]NCQ04051.1 hypothetical protein [Cyanobacteria bacterium CG_2015-09_32_10]NCQ42406.1 hypothetical protein [Cyanobacteria bacterium CG_2015-04_32_10]NCS84061.1 hypothetical protein [Cyanobacteria bacterium CG_2015-02_32_10]
MSGSPKYSRATIVQQRQQQLETERKRKAEEERKQREAEMARQREIRLNNLRNQLNSQIEAIALDINRQEDSLYPQDTQQLEDRVAKLEEKRQKATNETQLQAITSEIEEIKADIYLAVSRKRRDDAEKQRRAEIEKLQFEFTELKTQLQQIDDAIRTKFDINGTANVESKLNRLQQAFNGGNPEVIKPLLQDCQGLLERHLKRVLEGQKQWEKTKNEAKQAEGELQALISGLKADTVVFSWCPHLIAELEQLQTQIQNSIKLEDFQQPLQILTQAQTQSENIIKTANEAQLKAEQRDYIADSIAQSLEEMGFNLVYRQAEHPDHPATAIILGAATNSGKGISVSVPVQGKIYYDIDGYTKTTTTNVNGEVTASCDEAEGAISELHDLLQAEFGIKMDELLWEGKDPKRITRKADELPNYDQKSKSSQSI